MRKDVRCMAPAICGITNPDIRMTTIYRILVRVGTRAKLMPSMANIAPETPTVGCSGV